MTKAYINALSEGSKQEILEWLAKMDAENDLLREQVELAQKDAEAARKALEYNLGNAHRTTRAFQEERDAIIRQLRRKYSTIEVAEMVGLTRQRVHQILNEAPVEPYPNKWPR